LGDVQIDGLGEPDGFVEPILRRVGRGDVAAGAGFGA
jgi:hypothetical protein